MPFLLQALSEALIQWFARQVFGPIVWAMLESRPDALAYLVGEGFSVRVVWQVLEELHVGTFLRLRNTRAQVVNQLWEEFVRGVADHLRERWNALAGAALPAPAGLPPGAPVPGRPPVAVPGPNVQERAALLWANVRLVVTAIADTLRGVGVMSALIIGFSAIIVLAFSGYMWLKLDAVLRAIHHFGGQMHVDLVVWGHAALIYAIAGGVIALLLLALLSILSRTARSVWWLGANIILFAVIVSATFAVALNFTDSVVCFAETRRLLTVGVPAERLYSGAESAMLWGFAAWLVTITLPLAVAWGVLTTGNALGDAVAGIFGGDVPLERIRDVFKIATLITLAWGCALFFLGYFGAPGPMHWAVTNGVFLIVGTTLFASVITLRAMMQPGSGLRTVLTVVAVAMTCILAWGVFSLFGGQEMLHDLLIRWRGWHPLQAEYRPYAPGGVLTEYSTMPRWLNGIVEWLRRYRLPVAVITLVAVGLWVRGVSDRPTWVSRRAGDLGLAMMLIPIVLVLLLFFNRLFS